MGRVTLLYRQSNHYMGFNFFEYVILNFFKMLSNIYISLVEIKINMGYTAQTEHKLNQCRNRYKIVMGIFSELCSKTSVLV